VALGGLRTAFGARARGWSVFSQRATVVWSEGERDRGVSERDAGSLHPALEHPRVMGKEKKTKCATIIEVLLEDHLSPTRRNPVLRETHRPTELP